MKLNLSFRNEKEMKLPVNYDNASTYQRRIVREEYASRQNGLCQHCKMPLYGESKHRNVALKLSLFPPNFFNYPVHLHHDHNTGMTIGAVHNYCNAYLWQYHGE